MPESKPATFDEWWATYDPNDMDEASQRNFAQMVWAEAVEAERERCIRVAKEQEYATLLAAGLDGQQAARNMMLWIIRAIREGKP